MIITSNIKLIAHFKEYIFEYTLNILGLLFIYFIPTFSHMLEFPLYFFEPMRIVIILSLLHSKKFNSFLLAVTLPLFSFLISSHPVFIKVILISIELLLNVYIYHFLLRKNISSFLAIIGSIFISKIVYYMLKFLLINFLILNSTLISTPIYIQVGVLFIFGLYAFLISKSENKKNKINNL